MQYIAVLGRQPEFGLAELESLLGAKQIAPVSDTIAQLTVNSPIPFERFGSIIKFAQIQAELSRYDAEYLSSEIAQLIERLHPHEPGVKLKIGISDYSNTLSSRGVNVVALSVKKVLKNNGYSVRIIPNKTAKLGSAHIIHNKLTGPNGVECLIFRNKGALQLATTIYEQDIEAYAARDQARPMRDARVGMLPPKLAQTIINLAAGPVGARGLGTGNQGDSTAPVSSTHSPIPTILDPFCGTGVVLQEALLMGYNAYGTDIEPRMIDYSNQNLAWLQQRIIGSHGSAITSVGDASSFTWQQPIDYIAAETYLGRPLSTLPSQTQLMDIVQSVNTLHKKVLLNIHRQISSQTRICLAVPAWKTKNGYVHLPILDQLDKLGYNQLVFSHVDASHLIYARADQIVARQLVVLKKQ